MKYIILIFIFTLSISLSAQDIEKDGKDITETLKLNKKRAILEQANLTSEKIKIKDKALEEEANVQKEAEKTGKREEKAQDRLDNA